MSEDVLTTDTTYEKIARQIRESGEYLKLGGYERIVFANGCFDLLHPGHMVLLQECRRIAGAWGAVVVGLNSDSSIKRLKGISRPIMDEAARAHMLLSVRWVDHVVTFEEDTPLLLIKSLSPDVIVKGAEYKGKDVVGSDICPVLFSRQVEGHSTSELVRRLGGG